MRYDGMINQRIADEYKLDAFRIVGSLIKTSQEVCIHMIRETGPFADMAINGKYPMDLLPKIVNIVKGYKGAVAGLDESNYFIFRNHWGCRHVFIPTRFTDSDRAEMAKVKEAPKPPKESKFVPKKVQEFEKITGVEVSKGVFGLLNKEVPLYKRGNKNSFNPNDGTVTITAIDRMKNSKFLADAIFSHEFGHAVDWQRGLRYSEDIKNLMDKHRKKIDFDKVHTRLLALRERGIKNRNADFLERIVAAADTLKSLNVRYGWGHKDSYFQITGKPEGEFIAHAFENAFVGNNIFRKVMPDLYSDMVAYIKSLKPE